MSKLYEGSTIFCHHCGYDFTEEDRQMVFLNSKGEPQCFDCDYLERHYHGT